MIEGSVKADGPALKQGPLSLVIAERLARLGKVLADRGWDCLFATSPEAVLYYSGALIHTQALMRRHICGVLVTRGGAAALVLPEVDKGMASRMSPLADMSTYKELGGSACKAALAYLEGRGVSPKAMALEKTHLPAVDFEEFTTRLPSVAFPGADEELAHLRMCKSAFEIETMSFAATAMERAILDVVAQSGAGDREDDIAVRIAQGMQITGGGKVRSVTGLVASGSNLQVQHHFADATRLAPGAFVRVGCRTVLDGYYSMVVRTAVVGEGSPQSLDHYARLHQAHLDLLASLGPNLRSSDLFDRAAAIRGRLGVSLGLVHVGSGMGLEFKERPTLAPGSPEILEEGMVLTAVSNSRSDDPDDPGIRYIVDMVVIEANGARLLSHLTDTSRPLHIDPRG